MRATACPGSQRDGEIDSHGGLPDAALAAGDGDRPGLGAGAEECLDELIALAEASPQRVAFVAGHRVQLHVDPAAAGDLVERLLGLGADLVAQGTARGGEHDRRADALIVGDDVPDHSELDDAALQFRVLYGRERAPDVFVRHAYLHG